MSRSMVDLFVLATIAYMLLAVVWDRASMTAESDRLPVPQQAGPTQSQSGNAESDSTLLSADGAGVLQVVFSNNGKLLAAISNDHVARIWEMPQAKEVKKIQPAGRCLTFSPDDKTLAIGTSEKDKSVLFFDVPAGKRRSEIALAPGPQPGEEVALAVAYSANGKFLAVGCVDWTVRLCDPSSGKELCQLQCPPFSVCTVAFSPDGKTLAAGTHHLGVRLWDPASGKLLKVLPGHSGGVNSVRFSPDGKLLASASFDQTIRLWDATSGDLVYVLEGHRKPVSTVSFSRDGRLLASAGEDGTVQLWEIATGKQLHSFEGHKGAVHSVAFSPAAADLASGGADGTVRCWRLFGRRVARELNLRELEGFWSALGSHDGPTAYRAICAFAGSPERTIGYLGGKLQTAATIDPQATRRLLDDLDNNSFTLRQKASTALEQLGILAEPQLRQALARDLSPEARRRVRQLLEKQNVPVTSSVQLQLLRGLQVLEYVDSPTAFAAVKELASGPAGAWYTQQARECLERMSYGKQREGGAPRRSPN